MFHLAIPTFNDFNSLSCCLVANIQQPHVAGAVVVDNAPDTAQGKLTREFCASLKGKGVRYVPYPEAVGTAAAKNRAVAECPEGHVIGLDSHVLLMPGATQAAADFYVRTPDAVGDLIHGPMLHDNLEGYHTHLTTRWTPQLADLERQKLRLDVQKGEARAAAIEVGKQLWSEGMWGRWGTDHRVRTTPAFEIEAMGMGLFATHTRTWLGFHPDMRGFGGEEGYVHEKYRRAGKRVWCVSGFRWWHRFGKGEGTPHRVSGNDKYRNYLIGFREIGFPTDEVTAHFRGWLSADDCAKVEDGRYDPTKPAPPEEAKPGCTSCGTRHKHLADLPTLFDAVAKAGSRPMDINEHVDTLYRLAAGSTGVLDVGSRVESSLALAAGKGVYHHLGSLPLAEREMVHKYRGEAVSVPAPDALPEYDLVFIDTDPHEAPEVLAQLEKYGTRSRHRIVLHDTVSYGEQGSKGGPGVLYAVRKFVRDRPEWTVVRHDRNNNGLLTLSRKAEDKKKLPSLITSGVNVLKAMSRNKANVLTKDGPLKDTPTQDKRLALCMLCDSLNDGKCAECTCPVEKKTGWPAEFCPLGHWDAEVTAR